MEPKELELLEVLSKEHTDLNRLRESHIAYGKQIRDLERKHVRSQGEEKELRELKKQKLEGKTKMVILLNQYSKKEG